MELPRDFSELLASFAAHRVEFVIVGAYAVAFHGRPRMTGDLDVLVDPTPDNAERVMRALEAFGFGDVGLNASDFTASDTVVQLGVAPVRVDILTSITGVSWEEAWEGRVEADFAGTPVFVLGIEQLRRNKRATGRTQDRADLEALGDD